MAAILPNERTTPSVGAQVCSQRKLKEGQISPSFFASFLVRHMFYDVLNFAPEMIANAIQDVH